MFSSVSFRKQNVPQKNELQYGCLSKSKNGQSWFTNFPSTGHADELVEKVIYTSAGFLFYILVCITLTHRQKVCILYTESGSQEQM